jgi:hypothetical protein
VDLLCQPCSLGVCNFSVQQLTDVRSSLLGLFSLSSDLFGEFRWNQMMTVLGKVIVHGDVRKGLVAWISMFRQSAVILSNQGKNQTKMWPKRE